MKLHLPARLRSALLACLAVVAPLAGTVATGTFVGGAVVASLSLTEAQAAEVEVAAGTTVTYDASNTYVLKGGTLKVESGVVSSAITIAAAESSISLGAGATLSPLRVKLAEGVQSYKLAGTGTYELASATQMYGANASSSDWKGTVSIANSTGVRAFNFNHYGNADSTVKISGVSGWLAAGPYTPTILLEDNADGSALNVTAASESFNYTFAKILGNGTFERSGTTSSGRITYRFYGDVSGWTGSFLNNTGQTELIFENAAASVNLKDIVHGSGKQMTVKFQALTSSVVKSAIYATGEGKLNLEVGGNGGVTFTNTVDVDALTANETITIDSGAQVSVKGGGALNATLVNNGTLNLSGAFTVDSTALDKTLDGECTFTDGENGYQKSGSVRYTVVNNSATAKLNAQGAKITFDGAQNVNLGDDGTVTSAITTQGTIYWVRNGSVSYAATEADSYWLTDAGTLVLDKADESAQGSVLVGLVGSQGTVQLTENAKIEGKVSTKSAADLVISDGATLTVGTGKNMETYISSFSSVALDKGTLSINAKPGAVQNLKVTENNGTIHFADFIGDGPGDVRPTLADAYMFTGKTTLDGDLTITSQHKYVARFENLTGAGDFTADGTQAGILTLKVDSLSGYAGKLTLKKGAATTTVDIATGGDGVNFKGISATEALSLNLQIQSDTKMSEGLVLTNGVKTDVNITDGADLVGEIKVIGAGNTLTSTAAGIDLSGLNVTANASLVLGGKVTSLQMNQVGDVTMTDMRLEDGASLVYGADADTLHIAAENMLGSVKVDLNSLTSTQTLGIAAGTGLDLGIDKSVDEKLISVVADNVRDAKLDNSGDTWKLVSGVVSQYWEAAGGSGNWNGTDANWAFRDEAPADSSFVAGTDAIFSGDVAADVTIAENVSVQNLEIRSGNYTFKNPEKLEIKNDLVVETVNNFFVGDVEVQGSLRGNGYLGVSGDLKLGKSSEIAGLFMPSGTVTMTGTNTQSERNTDFTTTGISTCYGMVNVGRLTVRDEASMTVKSNTTIGSLAGAGEVVLANADLTLTDGESSIGSLKADGLELGKTVTLQVGKLEVSSVTAELGSAIIAGKTILTVNELIGATELTVEVGALEDLSKLTNGSVITLATVRTGDSVSGKWDISAIESETGIIKNSDTSFDLFKDSRGFGYEIITSPDNSSVTLRVTRASGGWIGTEEGMWTQTSGTEWFGGIVPGGSSSACFFGSGSSVVNVDPNGVETVLIDVDIAQGKLQDISSYKFVGGKVTADGMCIGQGELIIANRTEVNGDTEVYSNGKLTIATGGHMESHGNLSLTDDVALSLESDADLTVSGILSAEKDVTITNNGMLSVATVAVDGTITNEGTLQIGKGGTIGSIEGGKLGAMLDTSGTLKLGSANVSVLHIGETGSTVELSEDSVIGTLYSMKEGTSLISAAKLTLSEAAANQGGVVSVTAQALTLKKVGNEFGILDAPGITLDLKDSVLSTDIAAISVESLVKRPENAAITLGFTADTFDSIPVDEVNRLVTDYYKIISGVGSLALDDFSLDESVITEIARRGAEAEFVVKDGDLLLSITAVQGGMIWDTADGRLTNTGYEIPEGEGLYKALDYVEKVIVSGETTIDLTAQGVGNADAMATIPSVGIIIRNPEGGGTLTIVGDAPADDGQLPDVATVIVNKDTENPVALVGKSVKVNIGLPVGTEDGILTTDADSVEAVFASAEMKDGSVLLVNSSAAVEDETVLRDTSSLSVADGALFTTGMLNGHEKVTVSGRVNIVGVGGDYTGSYGESGAEVEFCKGAYQTIRAGKGLSLRVSGGEGKLDLADADAEMSSLGVGSAFTRTDADGSELIIRNVTLNDAAGRVEHHTLTLTESGNFVSSSELTVSLGVEETAETLGTDNAPVILDGSVRIEHSDICLKLEKTKDNFRALNVNPNAPLTGAKLATLATNGDVSADNEVVFVGEASLLNVVEKYYTNARLSSDGDILVDRVTDYYASKAGGLSETGSAGMEMLDKVLVELNPQTNTQDYQDLANVLNALDDAVLAGNGAEADELAASVTGASAAALGAALAGDMERQLRAIRNRTTTMGVDQSTVNHNMPYFNAWINAEYDNRKLNEDGTLSGYDYSVTGGTVGFDVDVTPRFVCGLALSALTGDMSSEGPDELEADVDSCYLTAFARTTYRRWTHTFVASVGKSDLSVDRTVSFSGGNYRTKGETEAMSFGFMYELGYVFALDADASTCLQPVFNVSVAHSSMDGYTESGSDAALEIGGVDMTTVTIGMGARLQSVVGQNMFNRASIFESRALIKVNAGDRDAEVDTALSSLPSAAGKLSCAERGPISLEIGAGITVPVGSKSGSIFLDGSAELGSEYTAVNATVGYRLNF